MILYIDTTDFSKITYGLKSEKLLIKTYNVDSRASHKTLESLSKFIKFSKVPLKQISKIVVSKGPGSYTGVRVGVSHALALSFGLDIPMQAISQQKMQKELKI